jgi:fluoroquinolone transport system permease protein
MKVLLKLIKWDFVLQIRYNIVTIAIIIAALYILLLKSLPNVNIDQLVILLVLSDPVMFGVMFIGVLVLYEKDNNTLSALIASPLTASHYLWSKAISLTLIAVPIALAISIVGYGLKLNYIHLLLAVTLTSIAFVFLGFIVVSKAKGFNQYIIKFVLFTLPVSIPILAIFDISHSDLFYLIPTHATILLLKSAFNDDISVGQIIYAIIYLLLWLIIANYFSVRAYEKNLLNGKHA